MQRRWVSLLVAVVIVALAIGFVVPAVQVERWVGSIDLEVEFVVTDAASHAPIESAIISVFLSERGWYDEGKEQRFTLRTDRNGVAVRVCHHNKCSGATRHWFGRAIESGWTTAMPPWHLTVAAPEYESTKFYVPDKFRNKAQLLADRQAKLVIPISLDKNDAGNVD